jgi:hypothetical protein
MAGSPDAGWAESSLYQRLAILHMAGTIGRNVAVGARLEFTILMKVDSRQGTRGCLTVPKVSLSACVANL